MIKNEEEAKRAINEVATWLRTGSPLSDDDYEPPEADVAREFCNILLDAARANGLCGCQLCQS